MNSFADENLDTAQPTTAPATGREQAGHRVAVFAAPADRESFAEGLQAVLRLTPIDSRIRLWNLPGILPERLSQESAERLAGVVRRLGGDADVVGPDDLPDLRHVPKTHHVRCTAAGLEVVPAIDAAVVRMGWERLALISVADVPLDTAHHCAASRTVVIRGTSRQNDADFTTPVRGPELWLVFVQPFEVLHIDHREMNYEYLGPRMTGSATANFCEFLADLKRAAPAAILTPTAQAFVAHDSVAKYRLETPDSHREIVELYAALVQRTRRRAAAPFTPSQANPSGKESVMDTAVLNTSAARLVELHTALQSEIEQLKAWLKESDEYGRPQFGQLGDRVLAIRNVIAQHFALEDEGGYMAGPLEAAPELADRAAELHADHPRLLAEFDKLAADLRECPCRYDCWSAARHDFEQLLDHLQRHEHRENEAWQAAFESESGSGD